MKTALLRGREHTVLGAVAAEAEGRAAAAISAGGAGKTYVYTDPNEDAALFVSGEAGTLLAVADGHHGFEASEVTLEHLLQNPATDWTAVAPQTESWERQARAVLADAHKEIQDERALGKASRTTLAMALVSPGTARLHWASVGDSHVLVVRGDQVVDLAETNETARGFFLGDLRATRSFVQEHCAAGAESLAGVRAVVLATDGISERGVGLADPLAEVLRQVESASGFAWDRRSLEVARGLVERAMEAHRGNPSGDNVAVAVCWVGA